MRLSMKTKLCGAVGNRVEVSATEDGKVRIGLEALGNGVVLSRGTADKVASYINEVLNGR